MPTTPLADDSRPAAPPPTYTGFTTRLFAYLFLLSLCFSLGGLQNHLGPLQRAIASGVGAVARGLGEAADTHGSIIQLPGKALEINHECTGIFVLLVYSTFVLAYPATWPQRASGIASGWAALLTINFARLVALTLIAARRPTWFDYSHEYFFQGLFIAVLAFLGSVWTEQVRRAVVSRVPG